MITHTPDKCQGQYCCIHNPSNHHMKDWPLHWRSDRGFMERVCECGVGHPDPDDVEYHRTQGEDISLHGCCGCCMTEGSCSRCGHIARIFCRDPYIAGLYPDDLTEEQWWCDECFSDRVDET